MSIKQDTKMEPSSKIYTVILGDTSANVACYMSALSLYNLSLSCKKFKCKITEKEIKDNVINNIHQRFRTIFSDDADEFVQALKADNGAVVGSLITQIMLGETWKDEDVYISIPRSHGIVNRFMNRKYKRMGLSGLKNRPCECDVVRNFYTVTDYGVTVHEIDCDECDVAGFKRANAEYCPYNHTYHLKTNELHIHQMHRTFAKQIILPLRPQVFETMFKQGFTFHYSDEYNKKTTDANVIYVQKKGDIVFDSLCYIMNNGIFTGIVNHHEILRVVNKIIPTSYHSFYIRECDDYRCQYVDCNHFHCESSAPRKKLDKPVLLLCE